MGLLSSLIQRDINKAIQRYEAENKRKDMSTAKTKNNALKDFVLKTIGFVNSYNVGRDTLTPPEYDFEEIKLAAETDSYIKVSLNKYQRLIYKAGYYLKSENEKCVDYINKRFRIMSYATGKPMDILFQEIADDLITYSNCFIIKTRVKQVMSGVKAKGLFNSDPVGGYSRIDPSTVHIQRDDYGNVLSYTQKTINGKEKKYKPQDVIHFYMNKESNNAFGTPKIIAALEDVKLLRRLEGNVLAIVHRFAMPLFHWKIGKAQQGFQATDKEIDEAKDEIENMSLDGVVITNEKTEINVLGAKSNAIDASSYLAYFEQRVFAALDTSASQMGRGGAKQDADSMEAQSHDYIKSVQRTLSIFIENYIISELLLEGGFNPILNDKDAVKYIFNEISLETKIKVENHELLKYQSNLQTLEEARRNIGYKETTEEQRLYKNIIEIPAQVKLTKETYKAKTSSAIEIAKASAELSANGSDNEDSKSSTSNNSSSNSDIGNSTNGRMANQSPNSDADSRNRPTNQYGTTSVNVKESFAFSEQIIRDKNKHKKKYVDFYSKINKLRNNLIETDTDTDLLISITEESLMQDIKLLLNKSSMEGINKAVKDLNAMKIDTSIISSLKINLNVMEELSHTTMKNIFKDIKDRLNDDRSFEHVDAVINALEYRFRFLLEYVQPKTVWYSYLLIGQAMNIQQAKVNFGNSADKDKYPEYITVNDFDIDNIPAYHPFCDCSIKFIKNK